MRRNRPHTALAIAQLRRHLQFALAANAHAHQALVPPFDHPTGTDHALEGLAARPGRIELAAVGQPAGVLSGDQGAFDGGLAVAVDEVDDLQFAAHGMLQR